MKRVAWLLLAVFCAALVQVPVVTAGGPKHRACPCCPVSGACGMPGCCPRPASPTAGPSVTASARPAVSARRSRAQPLRRSAERWEAFSGARAARRPFLATAAAPAAGVALFRAHCSFRI